MDKVFVTKPSIPPLEEYVKEIESIWKSCWLTNMGEKHNILEEKLKEFLQVPRLSLFSNGHMALELVLQSMGLKGEAITTPFTFASTTHAIVRNGLKPVFCDINEKDFTMDAGQIENLITEKTSVIVPVHVYGNICNVDAIQRLADKYSIKVVYDAAHAFAECYKGIGIGNYGDASVFSFHATKIFNTIEGGGVAFKDKELEAKLYGLKNFGIYSPEIIDEIGANAKLNEFQAAMGICNLRYIEKGIREREKLFNRYYESLKGLHDKGKIMLCEKQTEVISNYGYFPIIINEKKAGISRNHLFEELKNKNIIARKYFFPLTCDFKCYSGRYSADVPIARRLADNVLTLPIYSGLRMEQVDYICNFILEIIKEED